MSGAAFNHSDSAHGTALLAPDLTETQLSDAPILASVDSLLIEDLSEAEDDAFAAALEK